MPRRLNERDRQAAPTLAILGNGQLQDTTVTGWFHLERFLLSVQDQ
jgi:hypothetical protein